MNRLFAALRKIMPSKKQNATGKNIYSTATALLAAAMLTACATHTASNVNISEATAAADGTQLVVTGEVVQQIDKEHILLRDGTGQINVSVDEDILGKVKFAPDSRVRILGTVDRNSERSVLVAKSVQVVQ